MFISVLTPLSRLALRSVLGGALALITLSSIAQAADITWGGTYRIEGIKIENPELSGAKSNKAYLLHHLVLTPKIVAADGITIYSRFDLLNNGGFSIRPNGEVYSVAGDVIGNGPGTASPPSTSANDSNAFSRTQRSSPLAVTALYLSWAQEFGQLVAGRTPFHFGLGTAFNAGNGLFDHYIDTKDLVGYKIVLGNLSFFPMIGKANEGNLGEEDDINDYIIQAVYENPETELQLGILYQRRIGTFAGNDTPLGNATDLATVGGPIGIGGDNATRVDGFDHNLIALYSSQRVGDFRIGVEADLLSGSTGISTAAGAGVELNAFGLAGEVEWMPENSKWTAMLKLGMATGDDPGTDDSYEGFIFSRNYDVGMLMFNHPLGQRDFLRTNMIRDVQTQGAANQIDTEAISNAIYFAPSFQYRWRDDFSYGGTFVYAMLNKDSIQTAPGVSAGTSESLGFEIDLNLTYRPYERLTWVTELGFLFPGEAWKGGASNLANDFAYGITTKAAISF